MIDPQKDLKKILVPFDFSTRSTEALRVASNVARKYGASVHLLYVVDSHTARVMRIKPCAEENIDDAHRQAYVNQRFDEVLADIDLSEVSLERHCAAGHPDIEILRMATVQDFDLIVMGTHGHRGFEHLVYGSIAEKIVRSASCPVLVVKPPHYKFRMPGKTRRIKKEDVQ